MRGEPSQEPGARRGSFSSTARRRRSVTIIKQPELAQTLEALAEEGRPTASIKGRLAKRLVDGVRKLGGIWTLEDLASYRVVEREPLVTEYRGARIVICPPPSSGGVWLIDALNMLSGYDRRQWTT